VIYQAYGFTIRSAIAIPALSPTALETIPCDIHFELGTAPRWVEDALALANRPLPIRRSDGLVAESKFTIREYGCRQFFQLRYGDGTRFVLDHGATRIWGEPGPGLSDDDAIVYLLGPVMGFVLHRHGRTALHASAVAFNEHAVALVGSTGAGKSTAAAALALRGWPVLCEDVCAIEETDRVLQVLPGYPRVCLWPDSVNLLFASSEALPLIVNGWEKRYLPLDGSTAHFASNKLPLAAIYLLAPRSDDTAAPRVELISQREAVLQLVQSTYMNWLVDRDRRAAEFDEIAKLVTLVPCFQITPSLEPARLAELAALIESHVLQHAHRAPARPVGPIHSDV